MGMMSKGYAAVPARQAAYAIMDFTVQRQAMTMAFNDCFLLIGLSVLLVSPGVLMLRSAGKRPTAPAPASDH